MLRCRICWYLTEKHERAADDKARRNGDTCLSSCVSDLLYTLHCPSFLHVLGDASYQLVVFVQQLGQTGQTGQDVRQLDRHTVHNDDGFYQALAIFGNN